MFFGQVKFLLYLMLVLVDITDLIKSEFSRIILDTKAIKEENLLLYEISEYI